MTRYFLFSFFLASYVIYGWAASHVFSRSRGLTRRLRLLGFLATATVVVQAYSLLTHAATSGMMIGAAITAYTGALFLFACASRATRKRRLPIAFDPAMPGNIIMNGPFRYIRHPFYLSYCLTFLAGALSAAWWPAWFMAFLMWVFYFCMALAEERHLLTTHADTYARYRLATGAFIPRIILVPLRDAV